MDLLTHIFIPLIVVKSMKKKITIYHLFLIALFAILPDFDVFLGIHRGLFHSLFFILPLTFLLLILDKKLNYLPKFLVLALAFHLLLDFLSGGIPFLYPFINLSVGIEFPLVIKFTSFPYLEEYLPKIVFNTPSPVYGKSFDLISKFGIASMFLFFILNWKEYGNKFKNLFKKLRV